jgi:hypothetical protein
MDVVAHNAEIMDLEAELFFSPLDCSQEEGLHGIAMEDQLLPICPGGDVIRDSGPEFSISPHTRIYGAKL